MKEFGTSIQLNFREKILNLQWVHVCSSRYATLLKLQLRKVIRLKTVRNGRNHLSIQQLDLTGSNRIQADSSGSDLIWSYKTGSKTDRTGYNLHFAKNMSYAIRGEKHNFGINYFKLTLLGKSWKARPEIFPKFQFSGMWHKKISGKLIQYFFEI